MLFSPNPHLFNRSSRALLKLVCVFIDRKAHVLFQGDVGWKPFWSFALDRVFDTSLHLHNKRPVAGMSFSCFIYHSKIVISCQGCVLIDTAIHLTQTQDIVKTPPQSFTSRNICAYLCLTFAIGKMTLKYPQEQKHTHTFILPTHW